MPGRIICSTSRRMASNGSPRRGGAAGKLRADLARLDLGHDRVLLHVVPVVGNPVDQPMTPMAEFVAVHKCV